MSACTAIQAIPHRAGPVPRVPASVEYFLASVGRFAGDMLDDGSKTLESECKAPSGSCHTRTM